MSAENIIRPYVNDTVYNLAKSALLKERLEGFSPEGIVKPLSVIMPEKWGGQLTLRAALRGNFATDFEVTEVTLELGRSNDRSSIRFSSESPEPRDEFNNDFIEALENFDEHDHSICLLKYGGNSSAADSVFDPIGITTTMDASHVKGIDHDVVNIPTFAELQEQAS